MSLVPALVLATALQAPIAFERVDVLSEEPGMWVNHELPMVGASPLTVGVRFLEQVKVVWATPVPGLGIGTSVASQSVVYERSLLARYDVSWSVGLHTKLLLPRGVFGGLAWRWRRLRVALGVSLTSSASWARLDWSHWTVVPTVGLGVGRRRDALGDEDGATESD